MISQLRRPKPGIILYLTALILLAAPRLGRSLWIDEASSLWFARYPLPTLLFDLCDPHPPTFYVMLKVWRVVLEGEIWLRLLPLGGALLATALLYQLGQELCDRRCALLAAGLMALHPLQVWYAGELRMYTWAQALGLLAFLLGLRWLRRQPAEGRGRAWLPILYGLAALLALLIDYSALLALGLLQLVALVKGRFYTRAWWGLHIAMLVPLALWWLLSPQPLVLTRSYQPIFLVVQASRFGLTLTPEQGTLLLQAAVIFLGAAGILAAHLWQRRGQALMSNPAWAPLLALVWLLLLLFMAIPRLYSIKRLLVVGLPYLSLWLAMALTRPSRRRLSLALAGLTLVATLWVVAGHDRDPWRQVITSLAPADVAWVDDLATPVWAYYSARDTHAWTWRPLYGAQLPELPPVQPEPGGELLLITAESDYRNLALLLPPHFFATYALAEEQHAPGIGVYRYQRRLTPLPLAPTEAAPPLAPLGLRLPSPLDTCRP